MGVLDGKGGGRKGRFQGKVSKLEKRGEAEEVLREHIKKLSSQNWTIVVLVSVGCGYGCGLSEDLFMYNVSHAPF